MTPACPLRGSRLPPKGWRRRARCPEIRGEGSCFGPPVRGCSPGWLELPPWSDPAPPGLCGLHRSGLPEEPVLTRPALMLRGGFSTALPVPRDGARLRIAGWGWMLCCRCGLGRDVVPVGTAPAPWVMGQVSPPVSGAQAAFAPAAQPETGWRFQLWLLLRHLLAPGWFRCPLPGLLSVRMYAPENGVADAGCSSLVTLTGVQSQH